MVKKWNVERRKLMLEAHVFDYWKHTCSNPDGTKRGEFDVLECMDWVNVLALTPEGKLLMVRQYRFGADDLTLETVGGVVHANEDPLMTAQRELREECGYTAPKWSKLGAINPNPAFMSNRCHYYLAENAVLEGAQELDPFEEIDVVLVPIKEAIERCARGEYDHAIVVAGLMLYQNRRS